MEKLNNGKRKASIAGMILGGLVGGLVGLGLLTLILR